MKSFYTILFFLGLSAMAFAQVPRNLSYQAVARDASGACLANQTISLRITIRRGSATGAMVYQERFENNVQTNAAGHFQVEIGNGTAQVGGETTNFASINWNNQNFFL